MQKMMININWNGTGKSRCQGYAPTAYLVNIMLRRLEGYAPECHGDSQNN